MEYLVDANEMNTIDRNTSEVLCVPSIVLMERAAYETVRVIEEKKLDFSRTLVVCGSGNNGGDGAAVARMIHQRHGEVVVVLASKHHHVSESMKTQLQILEAYGVKVQSDFPKEFKPTIVIDAVFGVGLKRLIEGKTKQYIEQMNQLPGTKIAIDLPSGVNATTGQVMGCCFQADTTITYAYAKIGMYLWPGSDACGEIITRDIGIGVESWLLNSPKYASFTSDDLVKLPKRSRHSNKGTYGKLLVIAGSKNMAGAAILAAKAAYHTGCGLVKVVTPEVNRIMIQEQIPEAILSTYEEDGLEEGFLLRDIEWADAIVCGPGIGMEQAAIKLVTCLLQHASVPVLLDADALNILAKDLSLLEKVNTELICTPHPGEMSRLCNEKISEVEQNRIETARIFAEKYHLTCVLKGEFTVIASPEYMIYLNRTGNHGMAKAGSGDVLSGIIGSLMAQGMIQKEAAPLGVYLHGAAGDLAVKETGHYGLMAQDIVTGINQILRNYSS